MGIKCSKCHSDNPDTQQFCGECGTQLISSKEIPPSHTRTLETPKEEFTRGTTFAERYDFIEELGTGGMGSVHKVFDKKIKEEVALKILKPEITDEKTIERFSNELKLARKIRHENVCQMYDINEEEGIHYITMEYVPGEDLKSFIRRVGQLPVGKTISIAQQVCEGLSEAHRLGVMHRDLKPSNIMIDKEGNVRVMDFGIARSIKEKGITGAGVIVGTLEYMSPEQAEGKEVDQRSDIYSLGVILYEMVTGRAPFEGETPLGIAMKHKSEVPKDPREINAQIPEDLSRVILRCMEKDKEKRCQSAEEVLSELGKIGKPKEETIRVAEWKNSIAVLPFTNMSADPDQEYFCDGMAEELINRLAKIRDLRVVARTSAFSFKGKDVDVREIGKKLNVETVLEGSVRKAGNRLRITAQLVNVKDGYHLWSERYDRELENVFAIQDEISLAILDNLKVKLFGKEKAAILKRHTDNLEAYNLYLKGLRFTRMLTAEGFKKAIECFEQSLQKDPNNALTYIGMSALFMTNAFWGNVSPHEAYPKVREYAKKALEIDNTLAIAHSALGFVHANYDWDWKAAERETKQALQMNPNFAMVHLHYYFFSIFTGRPEEAIAGAKRAQELDPLSGFINAHVGYAFFNASQYDKAIEELRATLMLDPSYFLAHWFLGLSYLGKSMIKEAIVEFEKAVELSGGAPWAVMTLATTYYKFGKKARAEKLFDSLRQRSRNEYVPPLAFFYIHLFQGEHDQAFEWLERACNERDSFLVWNRFLAIDSYRIPDEPRFKALLKKAGIK